MELKFESLLDNIGEQILQELSENAWINFSELGRKVGLSSPTVTERVKKREALVEPLGTYGKTRTSIVLSTFLNKTP